MLCYGADFSGAKDPSSNIFYAIGELTSNGIIIHDLIHCDDRLDLFDAINSSKAPWGLDFPFALPVEAYNVMGVKDWSALMDLIIMLERDEFITLIKSRIVPQESVCTKHSIYCRQIDANVNAFSPLKKVNPNMQAMIYGGLKVLSYLRRAGNSVYPFDVLNSNKSRIYEVYPSHAWKSLGLRRSINLENFANVFYKRRGVLV